MPDPTVSWPKFCAWMKRYDEDGYYIYCRASETRSVTDEEKKQAFNYYKLKTQPQPECIVPKAINEQQKSNTELECNKIIEDVAAIDIDKTTIPNSMYCMAKTCRRQTEHNNLNVRQTKNGRALQSGTCVTCGRTNNKLLKNSVLVQTKHKETE